MFRLFGILTFIVIVSVTFYISYSHQFVTISVSNVLRNFSSINLTSLRAELNSYKNSLALHNGLHHSLTFWANQMDVDSNQDHPIMSTLPGETQIQPATPISVDKITNSPATPTLAEKTQNEFSSWVDNKEDIESIRRLVQLSKVKDVNCKAVFEGSKFETAKAINFAAHLETKPTNFTDLFYRSATQNCEHFRKNRGYIMSPLTKEEKDFPLAYSMLVFKNMEHVERLLRMIYRPQNIYCIHVDKKSNETFYLAVEVVANCFPNVFLTNRRIDVRWGKFSVLEPELVCMQQLWAYKTWKYFINLTGQEFPLKTNWELVKILTAYNGANGVDSTIKKANRERWRGTNPPFGIRPVKGSVHVALNRDFVDYILHNDTAQAFLNWTKTTYVPDETFFATLNHNPQLGIRGSYKGVPEIDDIKKPFLTRSKQWVYSGKPCAYKFVRAICIQTTADLPRLGSDKHMFANKFHIDHDRIVLGCLEEKLSNDTLDEYTGVKLFNTSYYENLDIVKNQVF